jgi:hypothetical protein
MHESIQSPHRVQLRPGLPELILSVDKALAGDKRNNEEI